VIRNVGVRPGAALVPTKALGTGIIATAPKKRAAPAVSVRGAMGSMIALNDTASKIMRRFRIHACSDVTGYGMLGHALEMASGTRVTIRLESASFPLLEGVVSLAEDGFLDGWVPRNRDYLQDKVAIDPTTPVASTGWAAACPRSSSGTAARKGPLTELGHPRVARGGEAGDVRSG